jgi:hypothetical protein
VDDVADERLMLWVDDHPENNSAEIAKYGPKYDVAFVSSQHRHHARLPRSAPALKPPTRLALSPDQRSSSRR